VFEIHVCYQYSKHTLHGIKQNQCTCKAIITQTTSFRSFRTLTIQFALPNINITWHVNRNVKILTLLTLFNLYNSLSLLNFGQTFSCLVFIIIIICDFALTIYSVAYCNPIQSQYDCYIINNPRTTFLRVPTYLNTLCL